MNEYLPVVILLVLVLLFVFGSLIASKMLAPSKPTRAKMQSYECGIVSNQPLAKHIPVKFYIIAIAFIVLDIEIIFIYPYTTVMSGKSGLNGYGLLVMAFFTLSLLVPFAYLLSVKALDWAGKSAVMDNIQQQEMRKSKILRAQSLDDIQHQNNRTGDIKVGEE